jgi:hypothetical protein
VSAFCKLRSRAASARIPETVVESTPAEVEA